MSGNVHADVFCFRLHGICVSDGPDYFHNHVDHCLQEVGIHEVKSRDLIDFVEGYKGRGYALSSQQELGT